MTDAATMDAGPGVVRQKRWKPLGFLSSDMQQVLGFGFKMALAIFSHGLYDSAVLGHSAMFPNILSEEGQKALPQFWEEHGDTTLRFLVAKGGGTAATAMWGLGNINNNEKDNWGDYLMRKIIPGALYCCLLGAFYGTAFPAALTSFIVTTLITDTAYKVLGEGLLGLPHIKS